MFVNVFQTNLGTLLRSQGHFKVTARSKVKWVYFYMYMIENMILKSELCIVLQQYLAYRHNISVLQLIQINSA